MSRTTLPLRPLAALAVLLGVALATLVPATAANAAAYRYWGYFQLSGTTWEFAPKGPADLTPADGSVEGWRFAIGTEGSTRLPRATPTFDEICGDTEAEAGSKRVAVVLDYGRQADSADDTEPPAPVGRCAVVTEAATGLEVLSEVADVRQDDSLICGIDDIPATGCGDEVKTVTPEAEAADEPVTLELASDATEEPAAADDEDDSNTGTYVGIGVAVLALAAVAVAALRRRNS